MVPVATLPWALFPARLGQPFKAGSPLGLRPRRSRRPVTLLLCGCHHGPWVSLRCRLAEYRHHGRRGLAQLLLFALQRGNLLTQPKQLGALGSLIVGRRVSAEGPRRWNLLDLGPGLGLSLRLVAWIGSGRRRTARGGHGCALGQRWIYRRRLGVGVAHLLQL